MKFTKYRFVIAGILLILITGCSKKNASPDDIVPGDALNEVLFKNNGWKSLAQVSAKNTAATGYQNYGLSDCGMSVDNDEVMHFILTDTKLSQQSAFTEYYLGNINLSSLNKNLEPFTAYQSWMNYSFLPGHADLLSAWTNRLTGPQLDYTNNHISSQQGYQGTPVIDEAGNIMTYGTLSGVGTENFVFIKRTGSQEDSLFTDGSQGSIYSGFYPALMKNDKLYAMVKLQKTVYVQRQNNANYANNQRGSLETIAGIECPDFVDNLQTQFLARTSPDRRFIYYWVAEFFSPVSKGWFFVFDVETESFSRVYNQVDLTSIMFANQNGKSSVAAIGDDGSLFIAGLEDPNSSTSAVKMYRMPADGTATSPSLYKSDSFLRTDAHGNRYMVENLKYIHGKLYFTVRSGLLPYENPQLDFISEE